MNLKEHALKQFADFDMVKEYWFTLPLSILNQSIRAGLYGLRKKSHIKNK